MRALLFVFALLLQNPATPIPVSAPPREALALSVDVNLVNVVFTVSDRKGRLVPTLPKERFEVFDDNHRQVITHFSNETDSPLTIGLLLDSSGSVYNKIDFEQEAAIKFLEATLRRGVDKAVLVSFDLRVNLL